MSNKYFLPSALLGVLTGINQGLDAREKKQEDFSQRQMQAMMAGRKEAQDVLDRGGSAEEAQAAYDSVAQMFRKSTDKQPFVSANVGNIRSKVNIGGQDVYLTPEMKANLISMMQTGGGMQVQANPDADFSRPRGDTGGGDVITTVGLNPRAAYNKLIEMGKLPGAMPLASQPMHTGKLAAGDTLYGIDPTTGVPRAIFQAPGKVGNKYGSFGRGGIFNMETGEIIHPSDAYPPGPKVSAGGTSGGKKYKLADGRVVDLKQLGALAKDMKKEQWDKIEKWKKEHPYDELPAEVEADRIRRDAIYNAVRAGNEEGVQKFVDFINEQQESGGLPMANKSPQPRQPASQGKGVQSGQGQPGEVRTAFNKRTGKYEKLRRGQDGKWYPAQ